MSCSVRTAVRARIQYASLPSAAIERGCSIGANHAQKLSADEFMSNDTRCDRTIHDNPGTFQQTLYPPFPKADHCSEICNAQLARRYPASTGVLVIAFGDPNCSL